MARKRRKLRLRKEEIAEDWCFCCKDGGDLLICEYKLVCKKVISAVCNASDFRDCLKAYHPGCVEKDDSFLKSNEHWNCNWHSCFLCKRSSVYHCLCCPNAVCRHCIFASDFVLVKGKKGFCANCLKLAVMVEEKRDVDSDGEMVDFKDRNTIEGLFMEYYEIVKEEENISWENVLNANEQLKMGKNYESDFESNELDSSEDKLQLSDEEADDIKTPKLGQKSKGSSGVKTVKIVKRQKVKSNKKEFVGWGSKSLIEFLASIGKNTSDKLSQYDVKTIIEEYVKENNLLNPGKKRQIICDQKLLALLGRKIVKTTSVYNLLEAHFTENLDESEEDTTEHNSENIEENVLVSCKKQRKQNADKKILKEEASAGISLCCFASIVPANINLVFLRKSVVEELLKQPETFESKITGSIVRIKSDPNDYLQRNSHQLVQVRGLKKISSGENHTEVNLQVSHMPSDICINMLSNNDFSEEECEDLRQKVKGGLLKRPTVAEFEEKARILHEDITKHWIENELALLKNLEDKANEKGWRKEFFEYSERRQLLQTPSEQSRLLQRVPVVIPDVEEPNPVSESNMDDGRSDKSSPMSILRSSSETLCDCFEGNSNSPDQISVLPRENKCKKVCTLSPCAVPQIQKLEECGHRKVIKKEISSKQLQVYFRRRKDANMLQALSQTTSFTNSEKNILGSHFVRPEGKPRLRDPLQLPDIFPSQIWVDSNRVSEKKQNSLKASVLKKLPLQDVVDASEHWHTEVSQNDKHQSISYVSYLNQGQSLDIVGDTMKGQQEAVPLMELSSDDDKFGVPIEKLHREDVERCHWHCLGPDGKQVGPCSLSLLKRWSELSPYAHKFKVWKGKQCVQEAISLVDAVNLAFPANNH